MLHYIDSGCYLYKFDISTGYQHIDIHPDYQCLLGFCWEMNREERYFVFTVLPFGLTSGPFVFTKVMRGLVKYWRGCKIRISVFLDDGLGSGKKYALAKEHSMFVQTSLRLAGFVIHERKSMWSPTTKIVWLGIHFDSEIGVLRVSEDRKNSLLANLEAIISRLHYTTPRKIACLCGKIMSTKFVLGNIVRLKTRNFYSMIRDFDSWDQKISFQLFQNAVQDLFYWRENFVTLNIRYIRRQYRPPIKVYSDASSTGIGAHMSGFDRSIVAKTNFTIEQGEQSSTWRELFAISFSLKSFAKFLRNEKVLWHTMLLLPQLLNTVVVNQICKQLAKRFLNYAVIITLSFIFCGSHANFCHTPIA